MEKVEQLQAVSYQSKSDGRHEIGVIAEDVDRVLPEVVSRDPETNQIQGVDSARLATLLIEAVKSQQAEDPAVEGSTGTTAGRCSATIVGLTAARKLVSLS